MKEQKYIVRCDRAGVFFAGIRDRRGAEADLVDARRIHSWQGATECIGIARSGVGRNSRITAAAPSMTVLGVIEVIPCSDEAQASLEAHPEWTL
jgi:hypothetical protein